MSMSLATKGWLIPVGGTLIIHEPIIDMIADVSSVKIESIIDTYIIECTVSGETLDSFIEVPLDIDANLDRCKNEL